MHSIRRLVALAVLLAACDNPSGPGAVPLTAGALTIVAGNNQQDTVATLLPDPIEVLVTTDPTAPSGLRVSFDVQSTSSGTPVPGQLVNFVVTDPTCGRPFAGSATTDLNGVAKERWELGTKAQVCHMEARAVDQATGEPIVFSTATATALPGAIESLDLQGTSVVLFAGVPWSLDELVAGAVDQYGNAITGPNLTAVPGEGVESGAGTVTVLDERETSITVGSGAVSELVTVAGLTDLRATGWGATYSCIEPEYPDVQPDSLTFTLVSDSVVYGVTPPVLRAMNATLWLYFSGTRTSWEGGVGTAEEAEVAMWAIQRAGSLEYGSAGGLATVTSAAPRTYTGGHQCPSNYANHRAIVLTAQ